MTTLVIAEPAAPPDKGLRAGALGLVSSVVIAVSSTAPAYSMAATLGLIVAIVGVHSPGDLGVEERAGRLRGVGRLLIAFYYG